MKKTKKGVLMLLAIVSVLYGCSKEDSKEMEYLRIVSEVHDMAKILKECNYINGVTLLPDNNGFEVEVNRNDRTTLAFQIDDRMTYLSSEIAEDGKLYWKQYSSSSSKPRASRGVRATTDEAEWIMDKNGNRLPDAGNHVQVRVGETTNNWEISTDGLIWLDTGITVEGASFFASNAVDTSDPNVVVITLATGEKIFLYRNERVDTPCMFSCSIEAWKDGGVRELSTDQEVVAFAVSPLLSHGVGRAKASDGEWEAGDRIGIYAAGNADYANIECPVGDEETGMLPVIPYSFTTTESVEFAAYSPYFVDVPSGGIPFSTYEQTEDSQRAFDFMHGIAAGASDAPDVHFFLEHKMAKIVLNFYPDVESGMTYDELKDMELEIWGLNGEGTFDPVTGTIVLPAGSVVDGRPIKPEHSASGDGTYRTSTLIVAPQQPSSYHYLHVWIESTYGEYAISGIIRGELETGKVYTINITVIKKAV